jgi:ATP-dependent Clp protease ATP-binding subunit ClpC
LARLSKKDIVIELDDKAKDFLVEKGFQVEMGARPLRRTIEQYLEDPLAEKLLMHPNEGRRSLVTVEEDKLVFIDKEIIPHKEENEPRPKDSVRVKMKSKQ